MKLAQFVTKIGGDAVIVSAEHVVYFREQQGGVMIILSNGKELLVAGTMLDVAGKLES